MGRFTELTLKNNWLSLRFDFVKEFYAVDA